MSSLAYVHRNLTGWRYFKQYGYTRLKSLAEDLVPGWNAFYLIDAIIRDTLGTRIDNRLESALQSFAMLKSNSESTEMCHHVRTSFEELRDGFIESLESCPKISTSVRRYWASACMACRSIVDVLSVSALPRLVSMSFGYLEAMGYAWYLYEQEHGVLTHKQKKAVVDLATKRYQHDFKKSIRCQLNPAIDMSDKHNIEVVKKWQAEKDGLLHRMALTIWKENAYDEMPVFADALRESECDDRWFIDHAASDCRHRKGCWLIDTFAAIY